MLSQFCALLRAKIALFLRTVMLILLLFSVTVKPSVNLIDDD